MLSYPRGIQVEVTNRCNLDCVMCIRRTWRGVEFRDIDPNIYRRLVDESAGRLERLALYGFGEPLANPRIVEMARYARERLGDTFIHLVTNGTLFSGRVARELLSTLDQVAFSIDSFKAARLATIRRGASSYDVMANLEAAARMEGRRAQVGVAVVVMKANYRELPEMVREAGEMGVDFMVFSHLVPYMESLGGQAVYALVSREAVALAEKMGEKIVELGHKAVYEMLGEIYGKYGGSAKGGAYEKYMQIWRRLESRGYGLNEDLVLDALRRKELLDEVEEKLREAEEVAAEYGVELDAPGVYADSTRRSCPYIDMDTAMVLASGEVVPCMDFAYTHTLYVNMHLKTIRRVSFGNLGEMSMEEIWNSPRYRSFREVRRNFSRNIPWCSDCPFSTRHCWYTVENVYDCYGNEAGCNECIYSTGLAKCII